MVRNRLVLRIRTHSILMLYVMFLFPSLCLCRNTSGIIYSVRIKWVQPSGTLRLGFSGKTKQYSVALLILLGKSFTQGLLLSNCPVLGAGAIVQHRGYLACSWLTQFNTQSSTETCQEWFLRTELRALSTVVCGTGKKGKNRIQQIRAHKLLEEVCSDF